jgi:hypothetical protein
VRWPPKRQSDSLRIEGEKKDWWTLGKSDIVSKYDARLTAGTEEKRSPKRKKKPHERIRESSHKKE